MCGLAGIFAYGTGAPRCDVAELLAIRDAMAKRGPDGVGMWSAADGKVCLAHRRLSIIDLSDAALQPMAGADDSIRIVFNGEIYNYRELRTGLEQKGYRFRTGSDTEVLLNLYVEKGCDMVHDLRGMYAFAIRDERRNALFAARDPFGIKPFYYSDDGRVLKFASQVKALLAGGRIDGEVEAAGHVGFMLLGYVPDPYTFYKRIRALPAGSTLWVEHGGTTRVESFHDIVQDLACAATAPRYRNGDSREMHESLRAAVLDSVKHHLVADVPVGVFLSSGLDSTTVLSLAAELESSTLHTVTLGFEEFRGGPEDETRLAEQVARRLNTSHQTRWVSRDAFKAEMGRLMTAMDQPSIDGVNTYFVSKVAAETGLKVAMSGLGGDELFAGYSGFREIPRLVAAVKAFPPKLGAALRIVAAPVIKHLTSPKYAGLLEYGSNYAGAYLLRRALFMPWELPQVLDPEIVRKGWNELQPLIRLDQIDHAISLPRMKIAAFEMQWYMRSQLLRDADWAGMAHSLEIRTPLVDIELLRSLAPMLSRPDPPTKLDLAATPIRARQEELLCRPKSGFSIPVHDWLLRRNGGTREPERGLRGWARAVYSSYTRHELDSPLLSASSV